MAATVGSVKAITIDGTRFPVAVDSDPTRDLGGFTKERMMNGDATSRIKMTPKPWEIAGIAVDLDDAERSQERVQGIIDNTDDVSISVEYVSGISYSGVGSVEGDLKKSAQSGTADITLNGGGKLTQD